MTASARAADSVGRLRVLIIDDHVDTAAGLEVLIGSWGHSVRVAHASAQAVQAYDEFRPVVGLVDLMLGAESGYAVARHLRERAWRRQFNIVIITGYINVADQDESTAARISHHLIKPLNHDVLKGILASYQAAEEARANHTIP